MTKQLQKFKDWLTINGLADNTAISYENRMKNFFAKQEELTEETINNFILELTKVAKKDTINGYLLAIRKFLEFSNLKIKTPEIHKRPEKIPKSFTYEYFLSDIIPAVEVADFRDTLQVKVVFNFLFFIPLRKSEIYNLKRVDIDLKERELKVTHKKTKKEKIFPIPPPLAKLMSLYFSVAVEEKNAFNLNTGSLEYYCQIIDGYLKEIHLHPHLFVHSSISYWASRGMNILFLSRFTGRSVETLQKYYVNTETKEIKKICDEIIRKEKRRNRK